MIGSTFGLYVLFLGRAVFGVGKEIIEISSSVCLIHFFSKEKLSLPLVLTVAFSKLGKIIAEFLLPVIASNVDYKIAFLFTLVSVFIGLILVVMIKRYSEGVHEEEHNEQGYLSYWRRLPLKFWIISINCSIFYTAVFSFLNISNLFFVQEYKFNIVTAAKITSLFHVIPMIIGPPIGHFVDVFNRRSIIIICSSFLLVLSIHLF